MKNIKIPWFIVPIVLIITVVIGFFYNSIYCDRAFFNIEKTDVDFIIQAPSTAQVAQLSGMEHIDTVVPFRYKSINISHDGKNVSSHLYVIESESLLINTVFSDKLKIQYSSDPLDNPLFLSDDIAKTLSVTVGDSLPISIGDKSINYIIKGIYGSDGRNVGGTAIAVMINGTQEAIGNDTKYNGAYICSNNIPATKNYLATYRPEGDIRSREEFDTDEQYQLYLDTRSQTDYSSSTFDATTYINEQHNRYDNQVMRDLLITIGFAFLELILVLFAVLVPFSRFENKALQAKKKSGATLKQIAAISNKYFATTMLVVAIAFVIGTIINLTIWNIPLLSIVNGTSIMLEISILVSWIAKIQKIKARNY